MSEVEDRERLRYLQLKRKKAQAAQQPVEETQPETDVSALDRVESLARGVGKGIVDIVTLPELVQDAGRGVMDLVGEKTGLYRTMEEYGLRNPEAIEEARRLEQAREDYIYDKVVDPVVGRNVPKGEDTMADMLYTFGEWGGPGAAFTAGRKAVTKGAESLKPLLTDAAMGTGAAVGEQVGGETGELIGGLGLPTAQLIKAVTKAGKEKLSALSGSEVTTDSDFDTVIKTIIDKSAHDPEQAYANLSDAIARGETGTLADLTKDRGVFNAEAGVRKGSKGAVNIEDVTLAREQDIIDDVTDVFPNADPTEAQKIAKESVETRRESIEAAVKAEEAKKAQAADADIAASDARIAEAETEAANMSQALDVAEEGTATAREGAEQAAKAVAPAESSAEISKALRETYSDLEKEIAKDIENPAWEAFRAADGFTTTAARGEVDNFIAGLSQTRQQQLTRKYGTELSDIQKLDEAATADDLNSIKSVINGKLEEARLSGNYSTVEKDLADVSRIIDDQLSTIDEYGAATAATTEKYARVKEGKLGKARRKEEAETFAKRLGWTGDDGAATLRLLQQADSPEVMKRAEDYLRSLAASKGVDDAFMRDHAQVLEGFPRLRDELAEAARLEEGRRIADKGLDTVTKRTEEAKKTAENVTQRELGRQDRATQALGRETRKVASRGKGLSSTLDKRLWSKYSESPNKTIDALLKNADDAPKLKRLMDSADRAGAGDSFRANVRDVLKDKLFTSEAGRLRATPKSIDRFVDAQENLINAGVLTRDEATQILKELDRTKNAQWRQKAAAEIVGRDTSGEWDNLVASVGAMFGTTMLPAKGSLVIAGALRRYLRMGINKLRYNQEVADQIEALIADPMKYHAMIKDTKHANVEDYADKLIRAAVGVAQAEQVEE